MSAAVSAEVAGWAAAALAAGATAAAAPVAAAAWAKQARMEVEEAARA